MVVVAVTAANIMAIAVVMAQHHGRDCRCGPLPTTFVSVMASVASRHRGSPTSDHGSIDALERPRPEFPDKITSQPSGTKCSERCSCDPQMSVSPVVDIVVVVIMVMVHHKHHRRQHRRARDGHHQQHQHRGRSCRCSTFAAMGPANPCAAALRNLG